MSGSVSCSCCSILLPDLDSRCPRCGGRACNCPGCNLEFIFGSAGTRRAGHVDNGIPGLWCEGLQPLEEASAQPQTIAAKVADRTASEALQPAGDVVAFRALARACGLTTVDVEQLTGKSSSVRKKNAGKIPMTDDDLAFFRSVWSRILAGDVDDLPQGVREMTWALKTLGGTG